MKAFRETEKKAKAYRNQHKKNNNTNEYGRPPVPSNLKNPYFSFTEGKWMAWGMKKRLVGKIPKTGSLKKKKLKKTKEHKKKNSKKEKKLKNNIYFVFFL